MDNVISCPVLVFEKSNVPTWQEWDEYCAGPKTMWRRLIWGGVAAEFPVSIA